MTMRKRIRIRSENSGNDGCRKTWEMDNKASVIDCNSKSIVKKV